MGHFLVYKLPAAPSYFPGGRIICSCSSEAFILFQALRYPFKDIYKTKKGRKGEKGYLGKLACA